MATNGIKSRYIPKNPGKYIGNPNNIVCRSRWETQVCKFFDLSVSVLRWASEEFNLQYISPIDRKVHKYYPDFYVEYKDKSGNLVKEIVEVKPLKESTAEAAKTEYDKKALMVNEAKWKAAKAFASANGMQFRVLTELSLFKQVDKPVKKKTVKPKIIKPTAPKKAKAPNRTSTNAKPNTTTRKPRKPKA